jgi:SPX domain protein involved in polyphosphate accumulation
MNLGRREAKYALPSESVASALRDAIRPFMRPDPYAIGLPEQRYRLVSLYLDTPSLDLYADTVRGEKNRHKLRIRRYPDAHAAPAFFEVKSKIDSIVRKRRATVRPEAIRELLSGAPPRMSHLRNPDASHMANLLYFRDLVQMGDMAPRVRVAYTREAWVDASKGSLRITFDREVTCSPTHDADVFGREAMWFSASSIPVVLEIKFDQTMPRWVVDLVQRFDLVRTSVPKYVLSIDASRKLGIRVEGRGVSTLD